MPSPAIRRFLAPAALALLLASCGDGADTTTTPNACHQQEPTATASIADETLDEISGLVAGRVNEGLLWVHNDSGDGPNLYLLDAAGRTRATYSLDGVAATDWEDIAIGPAVEPGGHYLYAADIGDNQARRSRVTVYRVEEPVIQGDGGTLTGIDVFHLAYPDGPHDAETLLVDPASGELIVVTKALIGQANVYRAPAATGPVVTTMELIATLQLGVGRPATGGDISLERDRVAIRTYSDILTWAIEPGQALEDALSQEPCVMPAGNEEQGKAIGFSADRTLITISEGRKPVVYRYGDPLG